MKPKPIIFNTEMVRAILDGRKTQTRRPIKPQPKPGSRFVDGRIEEHRGYPVGHVCITERSPYQIGDILYVRETWAEKDCNKCPMNADEYDYYPCALEHCPCPFDKYKYLYRANSLTTLKNGDRQYICRAKRRGYSCA